MTFRREFLSVAIGAALYGQSSPPVAPGSMRPDGVYQVGGGVSKPIPVLQPSCKAPDLTRKLRTRGDVGLLFVVNADGSVRDVQIVKPAGYGMDERAADCLRQWRFNPSEKDGTPVAVAVQTSFSFASSLAPQMWGAGPILFTADSGVRPPVLKSGDIPGGQQEPGDEAVVLEFTVSEQGEVGEIQPFKGKESKSLQALMTSLATWKFAPATGAVGPMAAKGKALFIKGEDYFRVQASMAFRDSGGADVPEGEPIDPQAKPKTVATVQPLRRIELSPQEAVKRLVRRVAPEYPDDAKKAKLEGAVDLLVVIGKDGLVANVRAIRGPSELVPYATAAVKQWQYRPVLSHGDAVEAQTVVTVIFHIGER